ncbi:hypothetical protein COU56_02445, partial [Candidatus Pacearchaeota archaeon CG10_big_fil_rev_8_21_14_0_10_31_9]
NYEKVDNGFIQISNSQIKNNKPSIYSSQDSVQYSIKNDKSESALSYMFVAWIIVGVGIFILVVGLIIAVFRR